MASFLFAPTPHTEAAAFIADKPALTRAVFDRLLPELRARAFTIAGVQDFDTLQSIRDRIADLPRGGENGNWDDIKKDIVPQLLPHFIDPEADAETQAKQTEAAERRAELLIRTHGQQAYATTAYAIADAQRDIFPFWMYQTLQDGHVRPSHAALDGIVLPCNDKFWATHTPPWDWGCRCQFIPITEEDAAQMRDQDKDKPYEQQRVLDDDARKLLNDANTIHRGSNLETGGGHPVPYNVASPVDSGKPNAYTWHPENKTLTIEDIKGRYDAQTWGAFEKWAKATVIPGQGRTIHEWLNQTTAAQSAPAAAEVKIDPNLTAPRAYVPSPPPGSEPVGATKTRQAKANEKFTEPTKAEPWKPRAIEDAELDQMLAALTKAKGAPASATIARGSEPIAQSKDADTQRFIAASAAINQREQAAQDRLFAKAAIYRREHPEGNQSEEIAAWSNRERKIIEAQFKEERRRLKV